MHLHCKLNWLLLHFVKVQDAIQMSKYKDKTLHNHVSYFLEEEKEKAQWAELWMVSSMFVQANINAAKRDLSEPATKQSKKEKISPSLIFTES